MNRHTKSNVLKRAKEGFTRRQIAKECGLTYGNVCKILREAGQGSTPQHIYTHTTTEVVEIFTRPFARCPGCGAKAQLNGSGKCLECDQDRDQQIKRLLKR